MPAQLVTTRDSQPSGGDPSHPRDPSPRRQVAGLPEVDQAVHDEFVRNLTAVFDALCEDLRRDRYRLE